MNYIPQLDPWEHQVEALDKMAGQRAFALMMAMRTGKTCVTIFDFGRMELAGQVDDFLLIAPAGVYKTWVSSFKEHASHDLLSRMRLHLWEASNQSKENMKKLASFMEWRRGPRVLLMNVEALSGVDRARDLVTAFASQRRCYAAVDESTTIKNIESERTQFAVLEIAPRTAVRRILSGLPTPRSPLDIYCQFAFLDRNILNFESYKVFEQRYASIIRIYKEPTQVLAGRLIKRVGKKFLTREGLGNVAIADMPRAMICKELDRLGVFVRDSFPKLEGYKNEGELREKIAPYSYRKRLEDCYNMPAKVYLPRHIAMTEEQKRIYNELKKFSTAELNEKRYVTASAVITRMLRLHQVLCGHSKDDETGEIVHIKENRTAEVLKILNDYDGKAIIWCSYDDNVQGVTKAISDEFGEHTVARFWGGNRKTREEEERRFKEDEDCRFMIATPAAGGRGRTWMVANLLIYYSSTNNLEHRSQSEERGSGNHKSEYITVIDLIVQGSIDEVILKALREKINLSDVITGDNWREWVV